MSVHTHTLPIVRELPTNLRAIDAFDRVAHLPHCIFFESALVHEQLGRYSFVAADPFAFLEAPADGSDALSKLSERLLPFRKSTVSDLPPFQGGAAGLLSYDLGRSFERVPLPAFDEFQVPAAAFGIYDVVIAFDHLTNRSWLISHGLPETAFDAQQRRAETRLSQFQELLEQVSPAGSAVRTDQTCHGPHSSPHAIKQQHIAPQSSTDHDERLTSNFSKSAFLKAIKRGIDYIHAGDVFQVNLAQRLLHPAVTDSLSLYHRLRNQNPATFAAYFDLGEFQIVSASPERFVRVQQGVVESRPIKGTRRRHDNPVADLFVGSDLQQSEKDRAENVMIVDLLRNDLSRVCKPESIRVSQLCALESYAYVQHLVSAIHGELRSDCTAFDLIRAAFPGGSITGAPKVRAMEIIAEIESTARGAYCGSLGYIGFDGTMDMNILIRTITAGRGWWQIPVGGGIVAQSTPMSEYEETWHKAQGILQALVPRNSPAGK